MPIQNEAVRAHPFLQEMYQDGYFPKHLVDEVKRVLVELCEQIESTRPADDAALLVLTHAATERVNDLQEAFWEAESEIETAARDCIGMDFDFVARAYGFDVDVEELISPRDW